MKSGYWVRRKLGRGAFLGCSSDLKAKYLWCAIRKMEIMHEVKVFTWKACYEGFLCSSSLVSRKVLVNARCSLCEGGEETSLHALWQYPNAKFVWKQIEFYSILKMR